MSTEALTKAQERPWKEWAGNSNGDEPPDVDPWGAVEYRLRNGEEGYRFASGLFWHHTGDWDDIVAYVPNRAALATKENSNAE